MNSFILLTVDCLRRDHVGCYGYDRPTTPYIDEFSEDSI
jgi:glucan phosphoethanolaminetransferase (alkaline phosphatase superfamily)